MYFLKHIKLPRTPINDVAQLTNENGENRATTFGKSDRSSGAAKINFLIKNITMELALQQKKKKR